MSSTEPTAHVAVVVLTWNGRDDTLACLRSLALVDHEPLTTIVVDNGSTDGTAAAVRAQFPGSEFIETGENLGFAEGNNVGMRRALDLGADFVLVLNNDTEVDPVFVTALLEESGRRQDVGALCSKIYFMNPPDVIWFAGAAFDPRRGYNGRQRGYRQRDSEEFAGVVETDRACGAAMFMARDVLDRAGFFDPDLFAYSEDTDWSLRARALGFRHYVVPASKVWHKVSAVSGGESSPATLYYGVRNTIAVCERHAPLSFFGTWRRRTVLLGAHIVQALLSRRRREGLAAVRQGWRDFRSGTFGPRPQSASSR